MDIRNNRTVLIYIHINGVLYNNNFVKYKIDEIEIEYMLIVFHVHI